MATLSQFYLMCKTSSTFFYVEIILKSHISIWEKGLLFEDKQGKDWLLFLLKADYGHILKLCITITWHGAGHSYYITL